MKTLVFGAGPLGSLYAHLLCQAGKDVTILARGQRRDFIEANGIVVVDELTGVRAVSNVRVVEKLQAGDCYDLVVVLVRKNKLQPVFEALRGIAGLKNILFMGNNALGFDEYLQAFSAEKLLFGFPGAGGGVRDQVGRYVDREKANGKRTPVTIGEIDGELKERTRAIKSFFESSGVPVRTTDDIDGWLKYHVALVSPLGNALLKHDCDNYALAENEETLRLFVRACKEGGNVLRELGYMKRQPFKWNLFYWLPEFMTANVFKKILGSRYAEIAYASHAKADQDEMECLAEEFKSLVDQTSLKTPNIDTLREELNVY